MPTLGLSMIVKNAAETLHYCLESVRGLASQIVVGDTGSSDDSPNIARACGATVVSVPWEDHFAKARNSVLAQMTTDWVMVLDPDEELDASAKQLIPALIEAPDIAAYTVKHRLYMRAAASHSMGNVSRPNDCRLERAKDAASFHELPKVGLMRRDPRIYFFGRVHELLEYRLCTLGLAFPQTDIVVHNFGYLRDSPEVRARKNEYYRRLGRLKVKEEKDNPLAWFDLGKLEYESFHELEFALSCFRHATRLHQMFTLAWLYAAEINLRLGQTKEALAALAHADSTGEVPAWRERLRGDIFLKLGQVPQARVAYAHALQLCGEDPVIASRLGYSDVLLGDRQDGFRKLHNAVCLNPHQAEVYDFLVKAYIFAGDLQGAATAAERCAAHISHPTVILRAAAVRTQLEQWEAAETLVCRGLALFPDSTELQSALGEIRGKQLHSAAKA